MMKDESDRDEAVSNTAYCETIIAAPHPLKLRREKSTSIILPLASSPLFRRRTSLIRSLQQTVGVSKNPRVIAILQRAVRPTQPYLVEERILPTDDNEGA